MKISFHGAAQSVTGSRHLLHIGSTKVLLDCGMFQGRRSIADAHNRDLGFDPKSVNAVLLSHGHIDHSGALPVLAKHRFPGKVHLTGATGDLTQILLQDSARIQEQDCRYVNKKERRRGKKCRNPFYTSDHANSIIRRFQSSNYGETFSVAPRIQASFHDAGHIIGSSAIHLAVTAKGQTTRILFSGDLGRSNMPILQDPSPPPPCDVLIIESTYGDRLHHHTEQETKSLVKELATHAIKHKSKIIVPAFAVGRTQHIIMRIKEFIQEGTVPPIPIYIDSPLATKATNVVRQHPEMYDEETFQTFTSEGDLFGARYIHYVKSVKESIALNKKKGPCVIIAGSGMCEGGRVVHHLKHAIQDEATVVVIVGFQAEHTLGRKLVEGWDSVPIFGVPTPRRARVVRINGLSAHADRQDLLNYVQAIQPAPSKVFVVHGEGKQSFALARYLTEEHPGMEVIVPQAQSTHDL